MPDHVSNKNFRKNGIPANCLLVVPHQTQKRTYFYFAHDIPEILAFLSKFNVKNDTGEDIFDENYWMNMASGPCGPKVGVIAVRSGDPKPKYRRKRKFGAKPYINCIGHCDHGHCSKVGAEPDGMPICECI